MLSRWCKTVFMSQQPEAVRTVEIRRWILLALLIVAGIINYADRQIISLLKPVISADLHWTDADYGRLGAVFQVAAALGFLVSGWLVDRLPVKWINPVGIAAWSVAAAAHGVVSSFGQFFIARAALGATESIGTPASIKTLSSLFPPAQRSTAIGVSNAAGTIGAMLTPVLIPGVALEVGWRGAFIVLGVIGLIWTIPWLLASRGLAADRGSAIGAASAPSYFAIARDRRTWAIAGAKALSRSGMVASPVLDPRLSAPQLSPDAHADGRTPRGDLPRVGRWIRFLGLAGVVAP